MQAGKKLLVRKGVLLLTRPARFQRAHVSGPVAGSEWHIQLPNGVSVAFSGSVDAATLIGWLQIQPSFVGSKPRQTASLRNLPTP